MKQVIITGASTGIGFDLTRTLCEKKYKIWACVRTPESLDRLNRDFSENLRVIKLDVTNSHEIQRAFEAVQTELNPDQELVLINNAGIACGGPIEGIELDDWKKVFDVNLFGMVQMTKVFLPLLRLTKGRVINMGSISGRVAAPFLGPYTASKFAVKAFTDSLRREVELLGVHVSLIEAGPIRTEIWSKSVDGSDEILRRCSGEVQTVYGRMMSAMRESVVATAEDAAPVQVATNAIIDAIDSRTPKINYLIGKNVRLQANLMKFMSSRMMDRVIKKSLRFQRS